MSVEVKTFTYMKFLAAITEENLKRMGYVYLYVKLTIQGNLDRIQTIVLILS